MPVATWRLRLSGAAARLSRLRTGDVGFSASQTCCGLFIGGGESTILRTLRSSVVVPLFTRNALWLGCASSGSDAPWVSTVATFLFSPDTTRPEHADCW